MSLVSFIGPRPNILDHEGTAAQAARGPPAHPHQRRSGENPPHRPCRGRLRHQDARHHLRRRTGRPRHGGRAGPPPRPRRRGRARRLQHHRAVGSHGRPRPHPDPGAAGHGGRAPAPRPQGPAHPHGLVVETGYAREVHHFALLAGYGAEAINPYLAFETLADMADDLPGRSRHEAIKRYIKAVDKGLLKVMCKMGISTYQSYCGAQIFDAVGLSKAFVDKYFTGTATPIEGVGAATKSPRRPCARHRVAFGDAPLYRNALDVGGDYAYRMRGEAHSLDARDHRAAAARRARQQPRTSTAVRQDAQRPGEHLLTIRGLFGSRAPKTTAACPLDEVEPASEIVKRFATGAMSFGSISREAHTTLAIAMNRIGGKSNTGEGGEESDRYKPLANGDQHAVGHQAGGVRPLRRHRRISGQRRHDPDQDGAGRQARRRRPAARPQGLRGHRQGAPFDARASA